MVWGCSSALVMVCLFIWRIKIELQKMALRHYILRVDLTYYQIMRSNCILYKIPTVWLHHKGNQMLKWPACCPDLSHFKHNKKEDIMKLGCWNHVKDKKESPFLYKIILSVNIINCEVSSIVFFFSLTQLLLPFIDTVPTFWSTLQA